MADRSAALLMNRFYYYLSEGMPTDVALQNAKKDLILKNDPVYAFPYFWSGYVIMGAPVKIIPPAGKLWLFSGILLSFILAFLIFNKKFRT